MWPSSAIDLIVDVLGLAGVLTPSYVLTTAGCHQASNPVPNLFERDVRLPVTARALDFFVDHAARLAARRLNRRSGHPCRAWRRSDLLSSGEGDGPEIEVRRADPFPSRVTLKDSRIRRSA